MGAGGGTSSYEEIETTEVIILWGSNARNAHPIFFHHVLKGIHNGAKVFAVDPRRSESAQWADVWLGIDVGTDIALSNAVAREIISAGLVNEEFIARATTGYDEFVASVEPWTLERAAMVTGVPAESIKELAHTYANAKTAQLCWTLGITEHHNATDNVLSLINLSLLTGHVGRYGSGLVPVRGQNNVQGGGDMGALPNKFPGFQNVEDPEARLKFETKWNTPVPQKDGLHLTLQFEAMGRDEIKGLYVIGENPAQSEADTTHTLELLSHLDFMVVQDIFLTKTAALADVVFPSAADWCEADGTMTSSERRVQRTRKALEPPGEARTDSDILSALAERMGHGWGTPTAEEVWDELRSLSPMHGGMSYARLEEHGGLQWPCPDEDHPGELFLHGRLWDDVVADPAPFSPVVHAPPVDQLNDDFPLRLTTGRHLDSYNTGVQSEGFESPRRAGGVLEISPEDAARLSIELDDIVRVSSRRGAIDVPAMLNTNLRPGLVFMTLHFPDDADVNQLTIEAWDPKSGTAEFKATAVNVEKLPVAVS